MNIKNNFEMMISDGTEITSALESIDRIFKTQLSEKTTESARLEYFFGKARMLSQTKHYREINELWNAMEPYVWNGRKGSLDDYWVIQVMREINTAWQVYQLNNSIDKMKKEQLEDFYRVIHKIEQLPDNLYLMIGDCKQHTVEERTIYSLKYFDEQYYHPYRDYIIRNILKTSGKQPFYIINIDSKGMLAVTGKEYFLHQDLKWEECKCLEIRINNMTAEQILTARRRGIMMGYVLDDL